MKISPDPFLPLPRCLRWGKKLPPHSCLQRRPRRRLPAPVALPSPPLSCAAADLRRCAISSRRCPKRALAAGAPAAPPKPSRARLAKYDSKGAKQGRLLSLSHLPRHRRAHRAPGPVRRACAPLSSRPRWPSPNLPDRAQGRGHRAEPEAEQKSYPQPRHELRALDCLVVGSWNFAGLLPSVCIPSRSSSEPGLQPCLINGSEVAVDAVTRDDTDSVHVATSDVNGWDVLLYIFSPKNFLLIPSLIFSSWPAAKLQGQLDCEVKEPEGDNFLWKYMSFKEYLPESALLFYLIQWMT
ncbi:hypothetical protein EJB05_48996, partial [Eragrostis curvula]